MIRETKGDLFKLDYPAIGHGVNTVGVMGAGIAVSFRERWPKMFTEYAWECRAGRLKLGGLFIWQAEFGPTVFNIATQHLTVEHPGDPLASMMAVVTGVDKALSYCEKHRLSTLALPWIGCGIGGLDYEDVYRNLKQLMRQHYVDLDLVEYAPTQPMGSLNGSMSVGSPTL